MNQTIASILERRSIREYRGDPVPEKLLDAIITAGRYAPSARNAQAWHIACLTNQDRISELGGELKAAILRCRVEKYLALARSPDYRMGFGAPVFMIVSADPAASVCPEQDCALVLGNMFIAAQSLGVSSCWVNQLCPVDGDPAFRRLLDGLGVPSAHRVHGAAAFGYRTSGECVTAPPRRENVVSMIK